MDAPRARYHHHQMVGRRRRRMVMVMRRMGVVVMMMMMAGVHPLHLYQQGLSHSHLSPVHLGWPWA